MDRIIAKVRNLIEDNYKASFDVFEYTTSSIFTLNETNINESSIKVYRNSAELTGSGAYSFDETYNKLTIATTLTVNDVIEVQYNTYKKYSDTEIKGYIKAALVRLSVAGYQDFEAEEDDSINPTVTFAEENLIALIASLLIKGSISSYKTPEISVSFKEDESIDDKICKAIRSFKKAYGVLDYHSLQEWEYTE